MADGKVPACLKSLQPYLIIHKQFLKRDPVVAYYASMYAVQEGIKMAAGNPEAKTFLLSKMAALDELKKALLNDEDSKDAVTSNIVGEAHVEEVAIKLFAHADTQDRNANFTKALIKSFYTASQIFSILQQFGELSEEVQGKMKYAKWKAVEIDKCLKNGITPTPGPPDESGDQGGVGYYPTPPGPGDASYPPPMAMDDKPVPKPRQNLPPPSYPPDPQTSNQTSYDPANVGFRYDDPAGIPSPATNPPLSVGAVGGETSVKIVSVEIGPSKAATIGPEGVAKVQKLCKFASSALDYDDTTGAIEYLEKALHLLKTGK